MNHNINKNQDYLKQSTSIKQPTVISSNSNNTMISKNKQVNSKTEIKDNNMNNKGNTGTMNSKFNLNLDMNTINSTTIKEKKIIPLSSKNDMAKPKIFQNIQVNLKNTSPKNTTTTKNKDIKK